MTAMWFPKPEAPADIDILGPGGGLTPQEIFDLLHQPEAVEWKEKVGVVTPADGSAKASTRLLKSQGWVFKTDTTRTAAAKDTLRAQLHQLVVMALRVDLWHPDKLWFLMRQAEVWWPISACPMLTTIRNIDDWEQRIRWWSRMIVFGVEMSQQHGIGLDLNPSNFAFEHPDADQLYYLDDEFYAKHDCFDVAEAVVSRIPEDPTIGGERWQQWGQQLRNALQPFCLGQEDWRHFLDGIQHYPFPPGLEAQRSSLLQGLQQQPDAPPKTIVQKHDDTVNMTCILADIHGNLPALETVLHEAKAFGVDSYLFLGDVVSYGPFPHECIERLANMDHMLYLRGNHDHTAATGIPENGSNRIAREVDMWTHQRLTSADRDWLLSLPTDHAAEHWLAVHGAPQDPHRFYAYVYEMTYKASLTYLGDHDLAVCFYGHTHVQFMYRQLATGAVEKLSPATIDLFQPQERLLLNPGSVGQPRDGDPRAAFAIWDRRRRRVTFYRIPYPVEAATKGVKQAGLPEDLIYRLEVGR
ncbi:hypothetical protein GF339_20925 [candidate division KSB3 bacterium]|uniref:Calcineurin-like phosphoesterase domain-containing protein n=1 Tax=candidate division KSB3 bacterium TaxID=2044937 RepID=A0A9D5JZP7_9BACT|nr:hypothetical protein [candidate division KSB3 bacterium]MBD3327063.1 hypothetical protein [candidate division KSB3 bacterium]